MKIFSNLRGSLPLRALLSGLLVAALILGLGSATRAQAADGCPGVALPSGTRPPARPAHYHCRWVGDFVWVDTNRDGVQDEGEPGIPGVTLTIERSDGKPVKNVAGETVTETKTGDDGKYSFEVLEALPEGVSYVVKVDNSQEALKPYVPTTAEQGGDRAVDSSTGEAAAVELPNNGDSDLTLDFGFVKPKVSVGDFVWVDTNGNGVQDEGEPGIPGVTLTIERSDGKPVKNVAGETVTETKTGDDGKYSFEVLEALPEGVSYVVKVDNSQDVLKPYVPTQTGQGDAANDSSNGEAKSGSLTTDGDEDLTLDFGFVKPEEPSTPAPTPPASSPESTPASTPEETTATPTVPTSQSPDKPRGLPNTGA